MRHLVQINYSIQRRSILIFLVQGHFEIFLRPHGRRTFTNVVRHISGPILIICLFFLFFSTLIKEYRSSLISKPYLSCLHPI